MVCDPETFKAIQDVVLKLVLMDRDRHHPAARIGIISSLRACLDGFFPKTFDQVCILGALGQLISHDPSCTAELQMIEVLVEKLQKKKSFDDFFEHENAYTALKNLFDLACTSVTASIGAPESPTPPFVKLLISIQAHLWSYVSSHPADQCPEIHKLFHMHVFDVVSASDQQLQRVRDVCEASQLSPEQMVHQISNDLNC